VGFPSFITPGDQARPLCSCVEKNYNHTSCEFVSILHVMYRQGGKTAEGKSSKPKEEYEEANKLGRARITDWPNGRKK
jgi:hypothetical protein